MRIATGLDRMRHYKLWNLRIEIEYAGDKNEMRNIRASKGHPQALVAEIESLERKIPLFSTLLYCVHVQARRNS